MKAVCRAGGHLYQRRRGDVGYCCERCVANAQARAERTVESRQKPKPKRKVQAADVYEVNR